ncbi:MAG: ATP-binding protein [Bifidobacteriaceae bacterium]|jgi:predicted AAA+ superfamily ATPase|nr:ATP-binding protein [Bifidobacteriaceae bacterium]
MLAAGRPHRVLDLDDPETHDVVLEDHRLATGRRDGELVVIDEVQRIPSLIRAIKSAIDADRSPGAFVLTGSSNLLDVVDLPDSLAGRAVSLPMAGFSQGELAGRRDDFAAAARRLGQDWPGADQPWPHDRYPAALARGGFPDAQLLAPHLRDLWIDSYIERLIRKDARTLRGRLEPGRALALLRALAANQAGELVKARLARAAAIPETSLTTYLDALAAVYLTLAVPAWGANLTKRAVGRAKCVVADPAIALNLNRMSEEHLLGIHGNRAFGALLEGFVVGELAKQAAWSAERPRIVHFRDANGLEVDIVLELRDGQVILIEVKASSTYRSEHFAPIKKLADRLGERMLAGIVLTTADHPLPFGDKLWGLPISSLWASVPPEGTGADSLTS